MNTLIVYIYTVLKSTNLKEYVWPYTNNIFLLFQNLVFDHKIEKFSYIFRYILASIKIKAAVVTSS